MLKYTCGIPATRVIALILAANAVCLGERFHIRVFGEREGLANPVIRQVAQDAQGMFWVLARNGLYLFDGERFTFVNAMKDRYLLWAQAAPDGAMWFRSGRAVHRWADGRFDRVLQDDALTNTAPQAIGAAAGAVWVAAGAQRG